MDSSEAIVFKNPAKINAGYRALETIPMELRWRGASHPLLLLDSASSKIKRKIIQSFQGSQMALLIHHMDRRLPLTDAVIKLTHSYKVNGCDAIIVNGSAALLDIARLFNATLSQDDSVGGHKWVAANHQRPLVAVISGTGQVLHLTESVALEGRHFDAMDLMPSLIVIDDRITADIKGRSALSDALATLTLACETLAFGHAGHFREVYAHCALKAVATHLPAILLKPKKPSSKTDLLTAELSAGLSAGTRECHPSWVLAGQIAPRTALTKGMAAAFILPSSLLQAKRLSRGRPDLLLTALAGNEYYSMVSSLKLNPWTAVLDCLNKLLDQIRTLAPGCYPHYLDRSALGPGGIDTVATKAAEKLDKLWNARTLEKILKRAVLIRPPAAVKNSYAKAGLEYFSG